MIVALPGLFSYLFLELRPLDCCKKPLFDFVSILFNFGQIFLKHSGKVDMKRGHEWTLRLIKKAGQIRLLSPPSTKWRGDIGFCPYVSTYICTYVHLLSAL